MKTRGFTLLELLVVLFVVSMLAGLVGLSLGKGDGGLRIEAERLFGLTSLAIEEAVLRDRQMGLRVARLTDAEEHFAYHWLSWDGRAWQLLTERPFEPHALPDDLQMRVLVDDIDVELPVQSRLEFVAGAEPQLLFGSNGEVSQFRIELVFDDEFAPRVLVADGLTSVRLETADD